MSPHASQAHADDHDPGPAPESWWAKVVWQSLQACCALLPEADLGGPDPADRRFADPAWHSAPGYRLLLQGYLAWRHLVLAGADTAALPPRRREQARFVAQVLTEALAPPNVLPGNPTALRRAAASRGTSLVRGAMNFLDDLTRRAGRPAKMPPGSFRVGEDLATTPGRVVYRDDLMEVLQYEPRTEEVYRVPLLLVPAWVNKFYVYDLAPGRSLVEWAVRSGFTVFAVSQRDPEPHQTDLGLDEYFARVPLRALDVVQEITGSPRTHLVGVCAGGMLVASLAAWLTGGDRARVASLTLLVSALDYAPSEDESPWQDVEIKLLTRLLSNRDGLVDGKRIGLLFDLLRSRDTVWQPLVSGWLLGERPAPFDIGAWSEDGIDVPRVLFEQTLRIAAGNSLALGRLRIQERTIDLSSVTQDTFVVAAARDHIVPWEAVYRSARLLGGNTAFHLVPSGHVGSIISPPRPKAAYRTAPGGLPADPRQWLARSAPRGESWWTAWTRWLAPRSGPRIPRRGMGSADHPATDPAPGSYVRSRET
ncbi:polyhydroxyalkanoate synthase [Streptoalloteichus tenebrarius]|uniref:Polyhydroxyalkanoate synthase n=1 Tax=Streptoalloteichus tenebrarius (strain ATCC 17920 / DSM 40477 / JCM 4838 / CBS 697.72 / NBRC 16177 / NCIMB 11028 / NRRL B-12390 / A12253. 1 / ISP 5477) TaxID=1933 RepID=A0ABT1HZR5_STRSD|nr:alpha/beta fold hydrolase [Streptoalloteichus tenebrarius]MCP2261004.1 polyhydroxyalkanoate synthase [Streptoalloteichus tenebrarius]BFE98945.1 class II poly(R)-hydroxyalkanoic acid synthase [Streptoalloteichus tenebrarius]